MEIYMQIKIKDLWWYLHNNSLLLGSHTMYDKVFWLQLKFLMSTSHILGTELSSLLINLRIKSCFSFFSVTKGMKIYKNEHFLIVKVNKSMSHIFISMQTQIHTLKNKTQHLGWTYWKLSIHFLLYPCFIESMFKLHNKNNTLLLLMLQIFLLIYLTFFKIYFKKHIELWNKIF